MDSKDFLGTYAYIQPRLANAILYSLYTVSIEYLGFWMVGCVSFVFLFRRWIRIIIVYQSFFFPYDMFRKTKTYQHVFSLMYSHLKDALKYNQPTHLSWSFYCSIPMSSLTWVSSLCHLAWRVKLINSSANGCIQRSWKITPLKTNDCIPKLIHSLEKVFSLW